MPSRSRHSRNNHSNRSSNKNRNRRDTQWQTNSNNSTKSESKSNLNTTSKKHINVHSGSNCIDKSSYKEEKSCLLHEEENKCDTIDDFEEEILFELSHDSLSISELTQLFEKYVHRRNASALFLFRIICEWVSCEPIDLKVSERNLLHHAETCDKIRNSLLKVLFGLTDKVTFKNITNQIAWALSIIKILSCGLPTLCTTLMHWLIKHVKSSHLSSNHIQRDELRFIVMFLRPEIVEQCAELVQFNASIFENVFRELIEALVDNYQPFRIWLFARLCSKKRKLIEAQLAKFICFGGEKNTKKMKTKTKIKTKRSKTWIVNEEEEDDDDCDEDEKEDSHEMNINRLMNAFKFCMSASNELVISNTSRTYYELGHLLLNEAISIANTLRYHFMDLNDDSFDAMLSIMHCNLGSIYLHENKYKEALQAANIALSFDINCTQSHRIRAEYFIKYARDTNSALTDLYEILCTDSDHPYAINTKKEIDAHLNNEAYICREIDTNTTCTKTKRRRNIKPCSRERHCAVSYRADRLIVYGGCNLDSEENEILNDLWILDINNNRWMQLDTIGIIPSLRHSHCANIIQHKLYIIGGAKEIKKEINTNNLMSNNNMNNSTAGYALSGWFTNFFNKNDEKTINKIKELARKGIIDEDEDEEDDEDDDDDESDKSYYDICDFPAIEMLDLKHNKWIKPETTGTSPKQMMINAHSVCVGKKIFVFPHYDNDELQYFVLETDTLHWESFEIPESHQILAADKNVIPVLYAGDEDKILFVTPFNTDCTYYKHCLLFTKSMQWSPIRKIPCAQLTAYDRVESKFAFASYANYIIIHGGILKDKKEKEIQNNYNETQSCILSKLPSKNNMKYNVIDDIFNMFAMCDDDESDDDSNESDESDDEESYDDDDEYHYNDNEYDLILSPLYTMNTNYDNIESRVSIVESLLFNKNPTEMHRIGPLNNNNYDAYVDNHHALLPLYNISNKKIIKRITTKTQIITTKEGKTRRRKTITTQHTTADEKEEKESEELLSNLEIFDFVSMRWLPRIPLHHVANNNNEVLYKFNNHRSRMQYDDDDNILNTPRMNHSVNIVGNNLCIFGGCESNSNVLMIDNFIRDTQRINDKYYSNAASSSSSIASYDETNALSLSKYLFGISPNIFSNTICNNSTNSYRMVQCANCLILECNRFNFRTCSGCAQVQYCSKLCQKNHWKCNHRHFCSKNHIRYQ